MDLQIPLAIVRTQSVTGGQRKTNTMTAQHKTQIEQIAQAHLGIETLASRNSDSLDFYDLGVGGIKAALEAAFSAGQAAQAKKRPAKTAKNAPESLRKYVECGNRIDRLNPLTSSQP